MFSIGIPAFKGRFLKECIDSILNQTYTNFELIIVNDCSPDPIDEIVNSYKDSRIKYYKNDFNIGAENVVDNWNKCLSHATKEFFILMGDDDKMEPDYLEGFIELINKYPKLDIYHCRSRIIDENSDPLRFTNSRPEYETTEEYILSCLKKEAEQYISDFVFRTEVLNYNNGFFKTPLAWAADYLSAYIACGNKGMASTNKALLNYRLNSLNITSTGSIELKRKSIIIYQDWVESYIKNNQSKNYEKIQEISVLIKKHCVESSISFFLQLNGKNIFQSLFVLLFKRKRFDVTYNDFYISILIKLRSLL